MHMLRSGALVHTFRMSGGVTDVHALRPGASPNPQVTARTAHMSGGSSCSEMCLVIAHRLTHSRIYSSFCASGGAERQRVTARQNHERGDVRLSSEMEHGLPSWPRACGGCPHTAAVARRSVRHRAHMSMCSAANVSNSRHHEHDVWHAPPRSRPPAPNRLAEPPCTPRRLAGL